MKRALTVSPQVLRVPTGPHVQDPWGRQRVPKWSVYQSCTDTGQSSDPSSPVGSRRAKSRFQQVSVGTLIWHNGTRQGSTDRSTVPYRCTIDVRTHTGPYVTLMCLLGTQRTPGGPPVAPSDPV